MIQICNPNGKVIKVIPNGNEFFNHVSAGELLEDHPEFDKTNNGWSFVIFPRERVPDLYFKLKPEFVTPPLKQAYEQQVAVIEICKGDFATPTWVPITPYLNIGMLKKDWYFAWCRAHGYTIMETENDDIPSDAANAGIKGGNV